MKTLFKNGYIVNVFLDKTERADVLIEDDTIIAVGNLENETADKVVDAAGKTICPGFIDGHIHIESSMLQPAEFVRACLPHGTTTVIADPHEIANVSGLQGIEYMLEATDGLPMNVYFMIPSCVPATPFDEAGAVISAKDIEKYLDNPRILGLGEMMNYPGVVFRDAEVLEKIAVTKAAGKIVNGHAPMLNGRQLDDYIASGIFDDHECSTFEEAIEKLSKGQWIMIRQGTAARNVKGLIDLFDEPYSRRCLLVTDDKHPADILNNGHIDSIIRTVAENGKSVLTAIRIATYQAAQRYGLNALGAIAPGYKADLLVLDDLETVKVADVYYKGCKVAENGEAKQFDAKPVNDELWQKVNNSFRLDEIKKEDFYVQPKDKQCRVIKVLPGELITKQEIMDLDFTASNGIDLKRDILKLAVIERHSNTGHIGLGFITGMGVKEGAIASSVSHDSHNLIVVGANEEDMAVAANYIRKIGGGLAVVLNGKILAAMELPISGLMGVKSAAEMAKHNDEVREAAAKLGHADGIDPFMNLAFVSLPVIPDIKMTTHGLIDVIEQKLVPLFVD